MCCNGNKKDKWYRRAFLWSPSARITGIGVCVVLLLLLVPLLRIAEYAVPWYDDFSYGWFTKAAMKDTPGIRGALKGAFECVRVQWYAWQGTFSSIFFMALMPAVWGEEYYFLGPVCLILLLVVSIFVLMGVLLKDIFGADRWSCLAVQSVTAAMAVVLIYSSQSGFYWYNAGVHYVGMHSFGMLFAACLIRMQHTEKMTGRVVLVLCSMLGALLVSGSNFVTALQGGIVLLAAMLLVLCTAGKKVLWYLPALMVYGIGFYKNVGAPGNAVRSANYVGWGYPPVEAVLRSFLEAFQNLGELTGWITIAILVLLVPVIWQIAGESSFSFRWPGVVPVLSFCLYAAGYTPSLYSLGHGGLSRTWNAVKLTYQILLVVNEIYLLGWFRKTLEQKGRKVWSGRCPWWFYLCVGAWMCGIFWQAPNQAGCYSSYGAYYYVHTGEAYNFYQEYQERLELLKSDEKNVVFTPYRYKPWILCMGDLYEDPEREENLLVETWYDKDSVIVREEASGAE